MEQFPGDGQAERTRGLKNAGEGRVIGLDRVAAHRNEVEEGGSETAVLDGTSNEGGPSDNATRGDRGEGEEAGSGTG